MSSRGKAGLRWAVASAATAAIAVGFFSAAYRAYGPGAQSERIARFQHRWSPFFGKGAPVIWKFIGQGVLVTLQIAAVSVILSLVFGTLLALIRLSGKPPVGHANANRALVLIRVPVTFLVQAVRASPLYMLIIYTFIAAPKLGLDLSPKTAGIAALTLYTSCVLAEVIRAGVTSLEAGQFDASAALGLSYINRLRLVILPQSLRRMAPAIVSQLVTLVKDTSLLAFITVLEVSRRLSILAQQKFNPIESLLVAGFIYFVINFALSSGAKRLEALPVRVAAAGPATIQLVGAEDQTRSI